MDSYKHNGLNQNGKAKRSNTPGIGRNKRARYDQRRIRSCTSWTAEESWKCRGQENDFEVVVPFLLKFSFSFGFPIVDLNWRGHMRTSLYMNDKRKIITCGFPLRSPEAYGSCTNDFDRNLCNTLCGLPGVRSSFFERSCSLRLQSCSSKLETLLKHEILRRMTFVISCSFRPQVFTIFIFDLLYHSSSHIESYKQSHFEIRVSCTVATAFFDEFVGVLKTHHLYQGHNRDLMILQQNSGGLSRVVLRLRCRVLRAGKRLMRKRTFQLFDNQRTESIDIWMHDGSKMSE